MLSRHFNYNQIFRCRFQINTMESQTANSNSGITHKVRILIWDKKTLLFCYSSVRLSMSPPTLCVVFILFIFFGEQKYFELIWLFLFSSNIQIVSLLGIVSVIDVSFENTENKITPASVCTSTLLVQNPFNFSLFRLHAIKDTIVIWNSKCQTNSIVYFTFIIQQTCSFIRERTPSQIIFYKQKQKFLIQISLIIRLFQHLVHRAFQSSLYISGFNGTTTSQVLCQKAACYGFMFFEKICTFSIRFLWSLLISTCFNKKIL